MPNCKNSAGDCREEQMHRIYDYLDGALSAQDIEEIRAHLDECETCAREYNLECLIRTSVRRSCSEQAPEELKSSILDRIDALRSSPETASHGHADAA